MATNNQKFNYWGIVLNAPKEKATHDQVNDFFSSALTAIQQYNKILFYASKLHDKDTLEDGTIKIVHLHIIIETYDKLTQLQALKEFSEALQVDRSLLSVKGSNNLFLLVQYLTHKNDQNKTQYDYKDIITNNREYLEQLYNTQYEDKETIIMKWLKDCTTLNDFMDQVGVADANKYRNLFKDLKIEQGQDIKSLLAQISRLEREYENLHKFTDDLIITLKNGLKDNEKRIINLDRYELTFIREFIEPK